MSVLCGLVVMGWEFSFGLRAGVERSVCNSDSMISRIRERAKATDYSDQACLVVVDFSCWVVSVIGGVN